MPSSVSTYICIRRAGSIRDVPSSTASMKARAYPPSSFAAPLSQARSSASSARLPTGGPPPARPPPRPQLALDPPQAADLHVRQAAAARLHLQLEPLALQGAPLAVEVEYLDPADLLAHVLGLGVAAVEGEAGGYDCFDGPGRGGRPLEAGPEPAGP